MKLTTISILTMSIFLAACSEIYSDYSETGQSTYKGQPLVPLPPILKSFSD